MDACLSLEMAANVPACMGDISLKPLIARVNAACSAILQRVSLKLWRCSGVINETHLRRSCSVINLLMFWLVVLHSVAMSQTRILAAIHTKISCSRRSNAASAGGMLAASSICGKLSDSMVIGAGRLSLVLASLEVMV